MHFINLAVVAFAAVAHAAPLTLPVSLGLPPHCAVTVGQAIALATSSAVSLQTALAQVMPTAGLTTAEAQLCVSSLQAILSVSSLGSVTDTAALPTKLLGAVPLAGLPLNGLPLNGLPLSGLPLNGLPLNGLPLKSSPLANLPLTNALPRLAARDANANVGANAAVSAMTAVAVTTSQLQAAMLQLYSLQAGTIVNVVTRSAQMATTVLNLELGLIQLLANADVVTRSALVNAMAIVLVQINTFKVTTFTNQAQASSQLASIVAQAETIVAKAIASTAVIGQGAAATQAAQSSTNVDAIVSNLRAGLYATAHVATALGGTAAISRRAIDLSDLATEACARLGAVLCKEIAHLHQIETALP